MRKGLTPPTHGVGSRIGPVAADQRLPMSGRGVRHPLRRPEPPVALTGSDHRRRRRVPGGDSLGLATASRVSRSSEAAYCDASDCSTLALVGNAMLAGTVETMFDRTMYAAVATAASFEAVAAKRRLRRYGR